MAGWTSLSGYLHYKPGGTLGRLKAKKKMWFTLEESQCQLLYFKTEDEAGRKQPQGLINLKGAAITLDLDNQNQFIIIVDGKDHFLTAENHESMMIWLMALQAKRDHFSKRTTESEDTTLDADDMDQRIRSSSDLSHSPQVMRSHRTLCATTSLHSNVGKPLPQALTGGDEPEDTDWRRYQLNKIGESIDTSLATKIKKAYFEKGDRSRSLPPVFEGNKTKVV
ncbi:hypothetical protein SNE40_000366 [Patella caerulea]|uniref:PH domain-containing protein n=1 Tax=Patella caerulea TaxID=87958 RepID=A0AAN8QGW2_PATCE